MMNYGWITLKKMETLMASSEMNIQLAPSCFSHLKCWFCLAGAELETVTKRPMYCRELNQSQPPYHSMEVTVIMQEVGTKSQRSLDPDNEL
ncbi:hypothetical protein OS493_033127 [Desmophyllum pertusum]|uniref:Uncharacterized protein n=1 Tax=Desmophyllum pertusum TaxID=174260 RepID=A0A9X0CK54_9CNID|nr:hypothetical protein OS493_033127 [Desmophyllum pertusum]